MIEAVLFDLDDVLIHEGFTDLILSSENPHQYLCEEALSVLQHVKNLGLKMALVSHNPQGSKIIDKMGLNNYFSSIQSYWNYTKFFHLSDTIEALKVNASNCLFCDDLEHNLRMAESMGIKTLTVNYEHGISLTSLQSRLEELNKQ
jgi:beta-phosphoglucomutase-like phosphatase (HAD superfamily)